MSRKSITIETEPKPRKLIKGTKIENGEVVLKQGYQFLRLSKNEIAVVKVKAPKSVNKDNVSLRSHEIEIAGSYKCRCGLILGSCAAEITTVSLGNAGEPIYNLHCHATGRGCKRGCTLVAHDVR